MSASAEHPTGIVRATIEPIRAEKILLRNLFPEEEEEVVEAPVPLEIHCVTLESQEPLVVAQRSLDHAEDVAKRVIALMPQMPLNPITGDLIALAFAVLHYSGKREP
jgi:hypothetical protein